MHVDNAITLNIIYHLSLVFPHLCGQFLPYLLGLVLSTTVPNCHSLPYSYPLPCCFTSPALSQTLFRVSPRPISLSPLAQDLVKTRFISVVLSLSSQEVQRLFCLRLGPHLLTRGGAPAAGAFVIDSSVTWVLAEAVLKGNPPLSKPLSFSVLYQRWFAQDECTQ